MTFSKFDTIELMILAAIVRRGVVDSDRLGFENRVGLKDRG